MADTPLRIDRGQLAEVDVAARPGLNADLFQRQPLRVAGAARRREDEGENVAEAHLAGATKLIGAAVGLAPIDEAGDGLGDERPRIASEVDR
mgnify:CR=1 FL=1